MKLSVLQLKLNWFFPFYVTKRSWLVKLWKEVKLQVGMTVETLRKRFTTYEGKTRPIINDLDGKGMLRNIDADRDIDVFYGGVEELISGVED